MPSTEAARLVLPRLSSISFVRCLRLDRMLAMMLTLERRCAALLAVLPTSRLPIKLDGMQARQGAYRLLGSLDRA